MTRLFIFLIMLLLILGLLTFSAFFILARKSLTRAVLLLPFLVPLDNPIYFGWGYSQLTPIRWALFGVFMGLVVPKILPQLKNSKLSFNNLFDYLKKDTVLSILLLLWIVRLISFSVSLNLVSSLSYQAFFTEVILIYLLLKKCVALEGEVFIIKFFRNYLIAGLLMSLVSPYQYYMYKFQDRILPGVWPLEKRPVRIGSLFADINHYAAYLLTVIPLVPYFFATAKKKLSKLFYLFSLAVILASFGMTLSRSAFIGLAIGFLAFLFMASIKGYFKQSVVLLVAVLVLSSGSVLIGDRLGLKLSYQLQKRFLSINFSYRVWDDSINAHSALAYGSWQVMENNPIIGGGYGSFNEQFRKVPVSKEYFKLDPVKEAVVPPHSLWFENLSGTGFLGFVPFVFLFFIIFSVLFQALNRSVGSKAFLSAGLLTALVSISLSGFFYSYNLEFFYFFVLLAFLLGVTQGGSIRLNFKDVLLVTFIVVLSSAFIFFKLDATTLIDWDESIYAKIAKNILNGIGDPFNLVWQVSKGSWFEKPPLFIWLTSFWFQIFGINEFSARLTSALSGVLSSVVIYFFGKNIFGRRIYGLLSAIVLATSIHYIFQSRNGTTDVLASFLILCSMYSFWLAKQSHKRWWLVGIFLGLTTLTKGPVVIIPILSLVLYILSDLLFEKGVEYKLKNLATVLGVFILVALPWHLVEYFRFGRSFIDSYLFYHILERSKGIEGHGQEYWWYLVVIKVWFRHWAVIAVPALVLAFFKVKSAFLNIGHLITAHKDTPAYAQALKIQFLLVWCLVTFSVLSASVSKIQWYIIPIYPPLALIIGWFLVKLFDFVSSVILGRSATTTPESEVKTDSGQGKVPPKAEGRMTGNAKLAYNKTADFRYLFYLFLYAFSIVVISVSLVVMWRNMWLLDDYNRGLKEVGKMIAEDRDRYRFLPRNVPTYIYNLPPGPPLFYTLRYAKIVGKSAMSEMFTSPAGKAFMAISDIGSYESLKKQYPNERVMIYAQSKNIVLFGKDWKDVREQFNQQQYDTSIEIYDPYFFCEWRSLYGNTLCD